MDTDAIQDGAGGDATDDGEREARGDLERSAAEDREEVEEKNEDLKNDPENPQDETEL